MRSPGLVVAAVMTTMLMAAACSTSGKLLRATSSGSSGPSGSSGTTPTGQSGAGYDAQHVTVHLKRTAKGPGTISFGLPVAPGRVGDPGTLKVSAGGKELPATVRTLLSAHDASGAAPGVRSVQIQLPASVMSGPDLDVEIRFFGGHPKTGDIVPFAQTSFESADTATTADRTIRKVNGKATLVTSNQKTVTLFTGREPAVLVDYPAGYLAATGILGNQVLADDPSAAALAGLGFIRDNVTPFGLAAVYQLKYPLNPAPDSVIVPDPAVNYEGWLYDRCATFLTFYLHLHDQRFLREAYRACSYYESKIGLSGDTRGIFTGKADSDPKYSHVRGLYAYYAITGDEAAKAAAVAISDLWLHEQDFVAPYAAGHIRSPDAQWTERLLGVSTEDLLFGFLLTDDRQYLDLFGKLLDTAYLHITGDAAALAKINPGTPAFPPQNCFIHTAAQHGEGNGDEPWCSGWMVELLLPSLLEYQSMTGDKRVDEIFVRLTRFLRDIGTSYFHGNPLDDTFLHPSFAYDPKEDLESRRTLVPLYGSGLRVDGSRDDSGEYDDGQHCLDGSALVAAGLRGLRRQGTFDKNPIGPFKSEGESFLALENELLFCAKSIFIDQTRTNRDPANWTSDALAPGLSDAAKFISDNKIGYPDHSNTPERRLSWWFNSGLLDWGLLADAKVRIPTLRPGQVQP